MRHKPALVSGTPGDSGPGFKVLTLQQGREQVLEIQTSGLSRPSSDCCDAQSLLLASVLY